jgi:hypothetical protein
VVVRGLRDSLIPVFNDNVAGVESTP